MSHKMANQYLLIICKKNPARFCGNWKIQDCSKASILAKLINLSALINHSTTLHKQLPVMSNNETNVQQNDPRNFCLNLQH